MINPLIDAPKMFNSTEIDKKSIISEEVLWILLILIVICTIISEEDVGEMIPH